MSGDTRLLASRTLTAACASLVLLLQWGVSPLARAQENAASRAEGPGEMISLRFAWPVGLRGRVSSTSERTVGDSSSPTVRSTLTYDFVVEPHARGLLIRSGKGQLEGGPSASEASGPQAEMLQILQQASAKTLPDFVVSTDGHFQDVADLKQLSRDVKSLIDAALDAEKAEPAFRQHVASMASQMLSPDVLRTAVAQDWETVVGSWLGADLELGARYQSEATERLPSLGNASLPMHTEFGIVERVACNAGDASKRCVRIESHTHPDPEALRATVQGFLRQMGAVAEQQGTSDVPDLESMDLSNSVVLVTEPDTLIPHRMQTRSRTRVRTRSPDGALHDVDQVETGDHVYTYEER